MLSVFGLKFCLRSLDMVIIGFGRTAMVHGTDVRFSGTRYTVSLSTGWPQSAEQTLHVQLFRVTDYCNRFIFHQATYVYVGKDFISSEHSHQDG
jgi:hypothetical protein